MNVITEARKINCSAMKVLTSNPNHWAKSSAVSKSSCSPKRKGTLAKSGGGGIKRVEGRNLCETLQKTILTINRGECQAMWLYVILDSNVIK